MTISVKYFFTVTLKPICFRDDAITQYNKYAPMLDNLLIQSGLDVTFVAELTKSHNIHFHGIIRYDLRLVPRPVDKFHNTFRKHKHFGFVNISQIEDYQKVVDYMSKDLDKTANEIGLILRPIYKDDFGIFEDIELAIVGKDNVKKLKQTFANEIIF